MSRASDLVQDAELETRFRQDYTVHIYTETGPTVRERSIIREEHWKRRNFVGAGSYGNVWLEQCVKGQRGVDLRAVKEVIKSPHISRQVDYKRELEAISKFSHRKYERCFVKSYGWYENDNAVYIAMEYFKHGDLHEYLYSAPPLPETDAQQITFQVLEGLFFMHENGYSHRDLKPGNILVRSKPPDSWWVKLSDFGISKRAADSLVGSSTVKGTLRYMAPELLGFVETGEVSGSRNAQAADMWALGEIAFQMLTKMPTFEYMSHLSVYVASPEKFPSAVLRAHDVSNAGIDFINSIMQPKPKDRQTSVEALRHAWMESPSSHTTGKDPILSTELAVPTIPLEESFSTLSGRWSTVSMAAPRPQSLTSVSGTATREPSTVENTVSFPETNTSTLSSAAEGTTGLANSITQASYFILKSSNETNIETSAAHGIWCCGRATNTRLSNVFKRRDGPIFLIFSVNESGFYVEWLSWNPIEFDDVSHLTHKEDGGVSVTRGRFALELCASTGMEMMQRFGVSELVQRPTQPARQPSDTNTIGSLGVGRLGLSMGTGTDGSDASQSMFYPDMVGRPSNLERTFSSNSTRKRPAEMEIQYSEEDKRQRI